MRTLLGLFLVCVPFLRGEFIVHEWGTFTSIVGSDGQPLSGLEAEEEALPPFVHSFAGFAPANKGWDRPVTGVTIKMETPVLYFYADRPTAVRVDVRFHGGSISQWYPERTGGEEMAPLPTDRSRVRPVDFSRGHEGAASWQFEVLPREAPVAFTANPSWETRQWPRARVAAANRIRNAKGEVESFVFYRGIGHFALPLRVTAAADGRLTLKNEGADPLPFVWIYNQPAGGRPAESWSGSLSAGEVQVVARPPAGGTAFAPALVRAGLTEAEAQALLATWRESYFERPGLRVFWIVPRVFTDRILPIKISPRPDRLERVLVGRTEVLTPEFETQLRGDFRHDDGKRWETDRYFRAYRERVQQLNRLAGTM